MAYVEATELARVLKIRTPSTDQTNAMERCLDAATVEIDAEIDLPADVVLDSGQTAVAEQVCLQRAAELWALQEVPLGFVGIGSDFGASRLAADSFRKYAITLSPLKQGWPFG